MASHQTAYYPSLTVLKEIFTKYESIDSGGLSAEHLQNAVSSGPWSILKPKTIRMIMGVFGMDKNKEINFDEFVSLWHYLVDWYNCFKSFDRDNNNSIDRKELKTAFSKFGYTISEEVLNIIMKKFDHSGRGRIHLDDFIQCCVTLKNLTTSFKKHDLDSDGWAGIRYNQFLAAGLETDI